MKRLALIAILFATPVIGMSKETFVQKCAKNGDPVCQDIISLEHAYGADYAEALKQWRKAAQQGNADAQNILGMMYDFGKGLPESDAEAVKWYRKAAEQENAGAQFSLGIMYEYGQGVPQNYEEAANWYRKAAEQGDAYAQNDLGSLYYEGKGVFQDYIEAAKWFRKAAEQGNADAQWDLGACYYVGEGVPQNYTEAYIWHSLAVAQGAGMGTRARDSAASKLSPEALMAAQKRAAKLFEEIQQRKAAEE